MSDIERLEQQWKKYQFKKRRVWYIFAFLLLLLAIFIPFGKNDRGFSNYMDKIKNITLFSSAQKEDHSVSLMNEPFTEIEMSMEESVNKEESEPLVNLPILDENIQVKKETHRNDIDSKKGKVVLDIVQTSSVGAYKDVERRFYQSHKIEDALFLAKSYYKRKNYTKAAFWALEANKLDNDIEESIFIFVKSKIKLGQKNKAISILKTYIEHSNSIEAKNLLYKIENESSGL